MKKQKKWVRSLFRQRALVILLLLLQVAFLIYVLISSSLASKIISSILVVFSLLVSIHVLTRRGTGAYKATWVFLILLFPLFGGLFYLTSNHQSSVRRFRKRTAYTEEKSKKLMDLPGTGYASATGERSVYERQFRYLQDFVGFPAYDGTRTKYLSPGEVKFEYLVGELEKAEKYIFLEYFIVHEGKMWDTILEVLKRKAAEGVKVRLLYDDFGCFTLLPKNYPKILKEYGIECAIFNPFRPFLTTTQNNRDHRKIVSIDGKVAFTGGVNLADEYINAIEKHGHWKDASVMIEGKAAWSFTLMFLQMWELTTGADEDYMQWYPWTDKPCDIEAEGFVLPYADSPLDKENVGEHVYMQILNNAKDYVYINTPYLIIDDNMMETLSLAAKSGVDVRIVTPHKGDRWFVHTTTRSYYRELIKAGVKIYEYTKGFIHSKTFVSDDRIATVGTINLDYRSLYLHFECGALMYDGEAVKELKEDFLKTLEICQPITAEDCKSNIFKESLQDFLRIFAPLM
ncbi:MAG: cardiolipin synthase [Christensenellales bacterium]